MLVQGVGSKKDTTETFHVPFITNGSLFKDIDAPGTEAGAGAETKSGDGASSSGTNAQALLMHATGSSGGSNGGATSTGNSARPNDTVSALAEDDPQRLALAHRAMEDQLKTPAGRRWLRQCAELQIHPSVVQLRHHLQLENTLGYFTLQRQLPSGQWRLTDASWGMPLFDEHLNAALCLGAASCALLSPKARATLVASQRHLTLRLLDFIVEHGVSFESWRCWK